MATWSELANCIMTDETNPWTTLSSQRFHETPLVAVDEHAVRHRSGNSGSYTTIRFKVFGVTVLPVDREGFTFLVGQYRYVSSQYTWELVRGAGDLGVPALDTAKRELREETGLIAGEWMEALRLMMSPGITDEVAPCFVAWDLEQGTGEPDPQETLAVRRLSFAAAVEAALTGEIVDAASVATILTTNARAKRRDLPARLLSLLAPDGS